MNKTLQIIIGIIVIVIIIVLVAVFYKPIPKETVKIGVIFPLTGPVASFGEQGKNGLDLAVEELKDINIELLFEDEKCDPKEAVTAYHKLRNAEGIKIIIGAGCSQSSLAIAPLAEKDKTILFTPMSAAVTLSDAGDFIFRNHTLGKFNMQELSEFALKRWKSVVNVYEVGNDNAVQNHHFFKSYFEKGGGEVISINILGSQATYQTEVLKIKQENPDVIHLEVYSPKDVTKIVKGLMEMGIDKPLLLDHAVVVAPELRPTLDSLEENNIETYFDVPDFDKSTDPEFWRKYKAKFNEDPTIFSAQSYDILKILSFILKEKCKSDNTECIRDNIYKIQDWQGASGLISFDSNGDAIKPLIIKTYKNGQFVPLEDF